jgi:hydrophobe/amphiphile efflux-3 (HAE3) family protein
MNRLITQQYLPTCFFEKITAWPKTVITLGFMLMLLFAFFLPDLRKDTRADAFIPPDHPALLFRDKTREIFGLQDPMVIAVINQGEQGVFNPHTLQLVQWLTEQVQTVAGIDADRITSLVTENNIYGTEEGMRVEPFFESAPQNQGQADQVRAAVMDFPLYLGSLVARDGSGTLIAAELLEQDQAQQVYADLLKLIEQAPVTDGERIHVAGEGAVAGYMGAYIDADAIKLDPLAGVVITIVCFVCLRTLRGVLLPNLVVAATAASALGLMAAADVPFYVITNAMPVVLIGIAVADSIHILSQYYEEMAENPSLSPRELTIRTMQNMWRPVTLTTLTTIAGFSGLSLASMMPPMKFFGLFAMCGVAVAWLYSITVVPAFLSILKLKSSPAFVAKSIHNSRVSWNGHLLNRLGYIVLKYPITMLLWIVLFVLLGIHGAGKIQLDEELIRTFHHQEPLSIADQVLNTRFDGTHYLDIMIETEQPEDLFNPEYLQRIEAFQRYLQSLPHVNGSTSIVDYLKQMNRALNGGAAEAYQLPDNADLIAQYFLLYSASSDPTDFQEEIDYDYQRANLRVHLDSGRYSIGKPVVEASHDYIEHSFNTPGIQASLSGRVNVDYHWIKRLADSHFNSIAIALLLVMLMAAISFRSLLAGIFVLLPVVVTILMIYAVMGFSGIWLSISTSMFAAISIGLGVDFSIHTLERLQILLATRQGSVDEALLKLYPSTGRALLFNCLALALGFGVLISSKVVVLQEFGLLVAVAIVTSFLASLTLLPVLAKLLQPKFLGFSKSSFSEG